MQKISSPLFRKSVFNIGAGKDLNPLIRFAHYSDTFIYTNLFLPKEEINSWYTSQFIAHPDFELLDSKVVDDRAYQDVFEAGAGEGLFVRPVYPFDKEFFMKEYAHAFQHARHDSNWLIYFEVKFKPLNKVLRLYYYNGEGVATYLRLSNSGAHSCRILVTIQTGFLEFPNRILDEFFNRYKAPMIWVRGYDSFWEQYGEQLFASGYFGKEGMSFNHHWSVGRYTPNSFSFRNCKGFITKETSSILSQRPNLINWGSSNHLLVRGKLEKSPLLKDGDMVVLPKTLAQLQKNFPAKVNFIYWESLVESKEPKGTDLACSSGAKQQISALRKMLEGIESDVDQRIHLIPFCLESEMDVYKKEVLDLPYKTVSYALHPLDFTSWEELKKTATTEVNPGNEFL